MDGLQPTVGGSTVEEEEAHALTLTLGLLWVGGMSGWLSCGEGACVFWREEVLFSSSLCVVQLVELILVCKSIGISSVFQVCWIMSQVYTGQYFKT